MVGILIVHGDLIDMDEVYVGDRRAYDKRDKRMESSETKKFKRLWRSGKNKTCNKAFQTREVYLLLMLKLSGILDLLDLFTTAI